MFKMVSIKKHFFPLVLILWVVGISQGFAQIEEQGTTNSLFYYSGTLGSYDKVELNFQMNGYAVSGSYILLNSGDLFVFKGRMAVDKSGVGLLVYDDKNNYVASVEAKIVSVDIDFAKEIKGVWKSANGKVKQTLALKKVAELASIDEPDPSYFE